MAMTAAPSANDIIKALALKPHPEGGHFREMFRDSVTDANGRSASTAIYFLLERGERSLWHTVDAVEIWHYYAGAPLELLTQVEGQARHTVRLGPDVLQGERPQAVVPRGAWQSARSTGDYTLVGCTVAPGFEFAGFRMAAPGWEPT
jgi:uncharacterized protein